MHFAQKFVTIGEQSSGAIRGTVRGADICEFNELAVPVWDASIVQMGSGHLNASVEFFAAEGFSVHRESTSQSFQTLGVMKTGLIAFGIPEDESPDARWWGAPLPSGRLPFVRSRLELAENSQANGALTVLTMDEAEFFQIFHRLTGLEAGFFLREGHFVSIRPAALQQLRAFLTELLIHTDTHERCSIGFADIVAALADALELTGTVDFSDARKASLVEKVLHEAGKSGFEISVPEISCRLKVSRRSIEYAFRERLSISPGAYFTLRRLDLCKRALFEADPDDSTVSAIATHYGFHELGRFASIYRNQFDELPSEALRSSRRPVPLSVAPINRSSRTLF